MVENGDAVACEQALDLVDETVDDDDRHFAVVGEMTRGRQH